MRRKVTQEMLRELMVYDPATGVITWKHRGQKWFATSGDRDSWNNRLAGKTAGHESHNKILDQRYIYIGLLSGHYRAHRLIWVLIYGEWPDDIDHINGISTDNRLINLRSVSRAENLRNRARFKSNTSGVTGVVWAKREGKWRAQIRVNTKQICLGYHADKFEAICARKSAERRFGFHPNHGRPAQHKAH